MEFIRGRAPEKLWLPRFGMIRIAYGVNDAIESIEQLLNDGQAAAVIELCESALQSLLEAIQTVDDSDGHFGTLRDRLQDIHYRACQEAGPDPAALARRLFNGN
jgi:hypothetical protein